MIIVLSLTFVCGTGSLLPKRNALHCLSRYIDRMQFLNATIFAQFSERRAAECLKRWKKNSTEMLQIFLGLILHHAISISML